MPEATVIDEHVFNDDLLVNDKRDRGRTDLEWAAQQFPEVFYLLDHERLRKKFKAYDKIANQNRDRVRRLGFGAVASATFALLSLATEPVWPRASWTPWLALVLEIGGLAGTLLAIAGISRFKSGWLHARLMTERIRQWHFQLILRRADAIEVSYQPGKQEDFKKKRDIWFDDFLQNYEGKQDGKLNALTGQNAQGETWLVEQTGAYNSNSSVFPHICRAFKRLRFEHQAGYANYKLRTERTEPLLCFIRWPAIHQMKVLSVAAGCCFMCALVCSIVLICSSAEQVLSNGEHQGLSFRIQNYVRAAAVAIALIGAALRTIQEGLAPDKEIERYEDYKSRTTQLRDRFAASTNTHFDERLHLMEELELAAVDEMKGFLRTHHNVTFVLA